MLYSKFGDIIFEEIPHRYTLNGVEYTPVSTIISQYENGFDADARSKATAEKTGRTQEEVLKEWKYTNRCATVMGTRAHEFGESYTNLLCGHKELICEQNKPQYIKDENWLIPTFAQEFAVKDFYDSKPDSLVPIGAEFKLSSQYIEGAKPICGTADILFYYNAPNEENSGFIIGDWKGLDVNVPILTTDGWKTMGTVQVGDSVYDRDGKECKVLHTSEVHHRKCYKISFTNGDSIVCDNEHRWLICNDYCGDETVMTADGIYDLFSKDDKDILIKATSPIQFRKQDGVDLQSALSIGKNIGLEILNGNDTAIPNEYLYSEECCRWLVLDGIIDVIGDGALPFDYRINCEGKELFVNSMRILLGSLGLVPIIHSKAITFICSNPSINNGFPYYWEISDIKEVESVPTRCIEVDSPSHTFLCGHNFLVTHNTNRELTKSFVRNKQIMMLPPFDNMFDEALSHYYLQFNLYQRMMESVGLKIIARRLIHIKRDGTFEVHKVPKLDDKIIDSVIMK